MVSFVGPSYSLETRKASVQRSVNWMLRPIEAGNEKTQFYLEQVPGLASFASAGAEIRGMHVAAGRCFVVAGSTLYEFMSDGSRMERGTLSSASGPVSIDSGRSSLVVVDGLGYVLALRTNTFASITDPDFPGATTVRNLDGFFLFSRPDSEQFFLSETIDSAEQYDALDFATAESGSDNIVASEVSFREALIFGEWTTEVWSPTGGEFYLSRNNGANIEVGCAARASIARLDSGVYWVGRDRNGVGMVFTLNGYVPKRVSTFAVEEALRASSDISSAEAFAYLDGGQSFYCVTAPGLESLWCYDVAVGQWHERCRLDAGLLKPWPVTHHAYAFGAHLFGGADGTIYRLDRASNKIGANPMPRERISPQDAAASRNRVFYSSFRLDATTGEVPSGVDPVIELAYSNDGGQTWGTWMQRSAGKVGEYLKRIQWDRLGAGRDRVWRVRTNSDARISIIGAHVVGQEWAS